MFKLFKKKSEIDKMYDQYEKLMSEANKLSKIDRSKGDQKYFEANEVLEKIKILEKNQ